MTWYGTPVVYKKDDIIVIAPRVKEEMLEGLKFEKMFEFEGRYDYIKIVDKKTLKFDDVFGNDRMARITRIAMDLDVPYQDYLKEKIIKRAEAATARKERQKMLRKSKIVVIKKGLVVSEEDKNNLACGDASCGKRFNYHYPLRGTCPSCDNVIKLFVLSAGGYRITRVYKRR